VLMVTTHICSACGGGIKFVDHRPLNSDGTLHWDVCKERQFTAVKTKGTYYVTDSEAGYVYKGEVFRTWLRGPVITGSKYKESCNCDLPPWEVCACSKFFAQDVSANRDST
jgi:hypothetical protein